jgi:GrpB-like predicted nucleotidyltransferase (UPF0157 family)
MELQDVAELAEQADAVVERFRRDTTDLLHGAEVHHIGATSMPFGRTKGDVDVNVRVDARDFAAVVTALREHYDVAQPENWTPEFASFSTDRYSLPFGIQITVIGSDNDHLLALRDRMRADPELLRRYDECKAAAASAGPAGYWEAKNAFLQATLGSPVV